jgi:hypothetical protein
VVDEGGVDALLKGRMAEIAVARDWELLREVVRLAQQDAPLVLSSTDPALFATWRAAVTKYHLKGWSQMTPERVDMVRRKADSRQQAPGVAGTHKANAETFSKFHIELLKLVRLVPGGLDPFAHMGHRHDGPAIGGAHGVERDAICEETNANRCIHGIG